VLKPTKLMNQMRLQSNTQTHLNQNTKIPIPHFSECGVVPPSQKQHVQHGGPGPSLDAARGAARARPADATRRHGTASLPFAFRITAPPDTAPELAAAQAYSEEGALERRRSLGRGENAIPGRIHSGQHRCALSSEPTAHPWRQKRR
jgi:hypothetical protein